MSTLHDLELIFEIVKGNAFARFLEIRGISCGNFILTFFPGLIPTEAPFWSYPDSQAPSASAPSPSQAEQLVVLEGEVSPPLERVSSPQPLSRGSHPYPDEGSALCSLPFLLCAVE